MGKKGDILVVGFFFCFLLFYLIFSPWIFSPVNYYSNRLTVLSASDLSTSFIITVMSLLSSMDLYCMIIVCSRETLNKKHDQIRPVIFPWHYLILVLVLLRGGNRDICVAIYPYIYLNAGMYYCCSQATVYQFV
jgi:purine-cytosine permease-like protein